MAFANIRVPHLTVDEMACALHVTRRQILRLVSTHSVPVIHKDDGNAYFDAIAVSALEGAIRVAPSGPVGRLQIRGKPPSMLTKQEIVARAKRRPDAVSGIYFLIRRKEIVYIGQAVNIPSRIGDHCRRVSFDSYHWIPCAVSRLDAVERAYLDEHLPPLNRDAKTKKMRSSKEMEDVSRMRMTSFGTLQNAV